MHVEELCISFNAMFGQRDVKVEGGREGMGIPMKSNGAFPSFFGCIRRKE